MMPGHMLNVFVVVILMTEDRLLNRSSNAIVESGMAGLGVLKDQIKMQFGVNYDERFKIAHAYFRWLRKKFNITHVLCNGKYIIVKKNCYECRHLKSNYKKYCFGPSPLGCAAYREYNYNKKS